MAIGNRVTRTIHAISNDCRKRAGLDHRTSGRRSAGVAVLGLDLRKGTQTYEDPHSRKVKCKRCIKATCQCLAQSPYFSAVTTLLTFYALFGDDMRLLFFDKPDDIFFDALTVACMAVFFLEIIVCSIGKAEYLFGFFFFLDILSTVTLVLDITTVAEYCFGDSISQDADAQKSSGGGTGGSDSAEAARAARMSRAGTKAGRVVRLIRLMRLLRLVKLFKRGKKDSHMYITQGPGDDWEDEELSVSVNESAVSKKLSEMTTRRVIMLVLAILLILPFFQADMYKDALTSSAQYGIDNLYRRFREDMVKFKPTDSVQNSKTYLASADRDHYVNDFLLYVYFHNWFCKGVPEDKVNSPETSFGKLFWIGGSPTESAEAAYFMPGFGQNSSDTWNKYWNGQDWDLYLCDLPKQAREALSTPWSESQTCLGDRIRGVSIIQSEDARVKCPRDLRFQERIVVSPMLMSVEESQKFVFMFVFDRRAGSTMEAALNSGQTIFICLLLGVGAMTFSKDANKLVLAPIERMILKLDKIRQNPIAAMSISDEEAAKEQAEAASRGSAVSAISMSDVAPDKTLAGRCKMLLDFIMCRNSIKSEPEPMETVVLEKTIIKIGSLLALGFGEAGAEVIGQNMRGAESSVVNAMIAGKKVDAIFGVCDIRNFYCVTESLECHVMIFVNAVASVVHNCITEFFGNPNQNVGNSFLVVWRLSDHEKHKQERLANCSVISFMKIVAQINTSAALAEYRSHPKIIKRIPGYRVRMGFGLHTGWAIEGAIGSEFKIDASYLSPNVDMTKALQTLTKQYGATILISEVLTSLMSHDVATLCRKIDRVKLRDENPFGLYTMDLDDMALEVEQEYNSSSPTRKSPAKEKLRQNRQRQRQLKERWDDNYHMAGIMSIDPDMKTMRKKYSSEFFQRFDEALRFYEAGEWGEAALILEETRFMNMVEDGPSSALLRYMKAHFNYPPPEWRGYRPLGVI